MSDTPITPARIAGPVWPLSVLLVGGAIAGMLPAVSWYVSDWVRTQDGGLRWTITWVALLSLPYGVCAASVWLARGNRKLRRATKIISTLVLLCGLPAVLVALSNVQKYQADGRSLGIQTHLLLAVFGLVFRAPLALVSVLLGWIGSRCCSSSLTEPEPVW